ncbi:MAG TPA: hypothetical protein HPP77_04705 [Candidatus Hydrogenedentes bacterium]|nr:hypothetical protein [Candidatus Hydrogenedentota bacterium]
MTRWLRPILPRSSPTWYAVWGVVWITIGLLAATQAFYVWSLVRLGLPLWVESGGELGETSRDLACVILVAGCLAYGFSRAAAYHPVLRRDYLLWLRLSPWSPGKVLPLGPVRLVWQDAVLLAVATLYGGAVLRLPWPVVPVSMIVPYLLAMALYFHTTGHRLAAWVLPFGIGLISFLWFRPGAVVASLAVLCMIAQITAHRSIQTLVREETALPRSVALSAAALSAMKRTSTHAPFGAMRDETPLLAEPRDRSRLRGHVAHAGAPHNAGWPLDPLGFRETKPLISYREAILFSLLPGWYVYGINGFKDVLPADFWGPAGLGFTCFVVCAGVAVRLLLYCQAHFPPISLWGRVCTLRLIVPRYDVVFLAPILSVFCGLGIPWTLMKWGVPAAFMIPASIPLALLPLLNAGPSLPRWWLTGGHRIATGIGVNRVLFKKI